MGMRRAGAGIVVAHARRFRGTPNTVDAELKSTAELDGKRVTVHVPQDPAQAGKHQVASIAKLLMGWHVVAERPTGDKITRAKPFSSQCEAGNVSIVRGDWNGPFLDVLEAFPEGDYDDDVDAASDGFNYLAGRGTILKPSEGDAKAIADRRTNTMNGW